MIFCWGGAGDGGTGSLSSCRPLLLVRVLGEFSVSEAEKLVSPDSPRPRGRLSCEYLIRAGSVMERDPELCPGLPTQSGDAPGAGTAGPREAGRDTERGRCGWRGPSEVLGLVLGRPEDKKFSCLLATEFLWTGVLPGLCCCQGAGCCWGY